MSLDYDISKIANRDVVCFTEGDGKRRLNPITQACVWLSMFTGIGPDITEDNIEEFWARIKVWETIVGPYLIATEPGEDPVPRPLTEEEVRAHIGLHTNAFPSEDRATFVDKVFINAFPKAISPEKLGLHPYAVLFNWVQDETEVEVQAKDEAEAKQKAIRELRAEGNWPNTEFATIKVIKEDD